MSVLMVLAMVSNTAFAGAVNDGAIDHSKMIAKTFNEFRYKMTVTVDTKDPKYQEKAVADFKAKLANLQAQGVSAAEIMNYMRTSILDEQTRNEFDRMFSSMDPSKVSSDEAGNMAMKFMANKYQQGANYSGGQGSYKWAMVVIGVVIVGVVTYIVMKHCQNNRTSTETQTTTNTNTDTITDTQTDTDTDTETVTDTDTCTFTNTVTITATGTVTVADI